MGGRGTVYRRTGIMDREGQGKGREGRGYIIK